MQQIWTIIQHDGPNRLDFSNQVGGHGGDENFMQPEKVQREGKGNGGYEAVEAHPARRGRQSAAECQRRPNIVIERADDEAAMGLGGADWPGGLWGPQRPRCCERHRWPPETTAVQGFSMQNDGCDGCSIGCA